MVGGGSGRAGERDLFGLPGSIKPAQQHEDLGGAAPDHTSTETRGELIGEAIALASFRVGRVEKNGVVENRTVKRERIGSLLGIRVEREQDEFVDLGLELELELGRGQTR